MLDHLRLNDQEYQGSAPKFRDSNLKKQCRTGSFGLRLTVPIFDANLQLRLFSM